MKAEEIKQLFSLFEAVEEIVYHFPDVRKTIVMPKGAGYEELGIVTSF